MLRLSRHSLGVALCSAVVYTVAFQLWLLLQPHPPSGLDDLAGALGPFIIAAMLALRGGPSLLLDAPEKQKGLRVARGILCMAAAPVGFVLAQVTSAYYEVFHHGVTPVPSLVDVAALSAIALLLLGVLLLPERPISTVFRARTLLDGLIIMTAAATYSWYFLLGPAVLQSGEPLVSKVVSASYPVSELILVLCLVLLWFHSGGRAVRAAGPLLGTGLALLIGADTLHSYHLLHNASLTGSALDPSRTLGWMLIVIGTYAAARSSDAAIDGTAGGETSTAVELWRGILPFVMLPTVTALVIHAWWTHDDPLLEPGIYGGMVVLFLLTLARQVLVLLENQEANKRLKLLWRATAEREATRETEQRIKILIQDMDVGVVLFAPDGNVLVSNDAVTRLLALPLDEDLAKGSLAPGRGVRAYEQTPGLPDGINPVDHVLSTGQPLRNLVAAVPADRSGLHGTSSEVSAWCLMNVVPSISRAGTLNHVLCTLTDISERKRAEEELERSEERFRVIFDRAPIAIEIADIEGFYLQTNKAAEDLLGYRSDELRGVHWTTLTHPEDVAAETALDRKLVAGEIDQYSLESRHRRKDGQMVWARQTESVVRNSDGVAQFYISMLEDATERRRAVEVLSHQAQHDALAGLPNRVLLQDRLQEAILTTALQPRTFGLLLLDLDRFKEVNDAFGHQYGDIILQEVGRRLLEWAQPADTVARLGGDEFAVLLGDIDEMGAVKAAKEVLNILADPFPVESQMFDLGGSIGIAFFPNHGRDANTLLRRADVAMYASKREESGYSVYTAEHDQHSPARLALLADLRHAIDGDLLDVYFQPEVDLKTGQTNRVEALARWCHPIHGFIPPDVFIPLAEQTGLIRPLSHWILNRALRQCADWQRMGIIVDIAVNLSARNLHDPDLVNTLKDLIAFHGIAPDRVELELTESAVMADSSRAVATLNALHGLGVRLAIDDFGTGYSSLGYLKHVPVDQIKIDKSFVSDMARSPDDVVIVRSVLDLGHNLGLSVVAEGVEDRATLELLREMGCDLVQGFYLSCPLPASELVGWLRRRRVWASAAS